MTKIVEFKKQYIDGLEEWMEIPVWDQEELIHIVNGIDWDEVSVEDYKKLVVENLPGITAGIKKKLLNPAVRNELYEVLLHENWGLAPAESSQPYYSEVERNNVAQWFASNKLKGRPPDVL